MLDLDIPEISSVGSEKLSELSIMVIDFFSIFHEIYKGILAFGELGFELGDCAWVLEESHFVIKARLEDVGDSRATDIETNVLNIRIIDRAIARSKQMSEQSVKYTAASWIRNR